MIALNDANLHLNRMGVPDRPSAHRAGPRRPSTAGHPAGAFSGAADPGRPELGVLADRLRPVSDRSAKRRNDWTPRVAGGTLGRLAGNRAGVHLR